MMGLSTSKTDDKRFPQKMIKVYYKRTHDDLDKNTAEQLMEQFVTSNCGVNSTGVIVDRESGLTLDSNYTNAILCSNLAFNGEEKHLAELVQQAESLPDCVVVFVVEGTLYRNKAIAELFEKQKLKNIAVVKDKKWEENGMNSHDARELAKAVCEVILKKEKRS